MGKPYLQNLLSEIARLPTTENSPTVKLLHQHKKSKPKLDEYSAEFKAQHLGWKQEHMNANMAWLGEVCPHLISSRQSGYKAYVLR